MANDRQIVRYCYARDGFSPETVDHAFKYLSILTSLHFVKDADKPDIRFGSRKNGCILIEPAGLDAISGDVNYITTFKNPANKEWNPGLTYDPIAKIIRRLSLSLKLGPYADRPIAPSSPSELTLSRIINDLQSVLAQAGIIENQAHPISLYPSPHKFGLIVSHDIDIAGRGLLGGLRLLANRQLPGGLPAVFDSLRNRLGSAKNPYDNIERWLELESRFGISSTFFIFGGARRHPFDPKYSLERVGDYIDEIKGGGAEIALHSGIGCHSGNGLAESKALIENRLGGKIDGVRPHYLSASLPEYWRAAQDAGFGYSSVLGFDDNIGYYRGIDLPIIPFDVQRNRPFRIIEYPIAIMDCGLIGNGPADSDAVFARGAKLVDQAASTGGLLVLDWHQRTFYNRDYPGWAALFTRLIDYARDRGAGFTSFEEITDLMNARSLDLT